MGEMIHGDALTILRSHFADQSVQCCVTSPPYWGLRDYGVEGQLGLESTPELYVEKLVEVFREVRRVLKDDGTLWLNLGDSYAGSGQGWMKDGTVVGGPKQKTNFGSMQRMATTVGFDKPRNYISSRQENGLKPKDLVGIPWAVAFALRADGWYLRSDIIWAKPNPMPESVTDRPTKAHEYLFLLSKRERYYYDADAIKEPAVKVGTPGHLQCGNGVRSGNREGLRPGGEYRLRTHGKHNDTDPQAAGRRIVESVKTARHGGAAHDNPFGDERNKRSVWTVSTQPYADAHFATFPEALIEPCILAGSRTAGKRCDCDELILTPIGTGEIDDPSLETGRAGMNRPRREDEGIRPITRREQRVYAEQMKASPFCDDMATIAGKAFDHYIRTDRSGARPLPPILLTDWLERGWLTRPAPCECLIEQADLILDPFAGSGTTIAVAQQLGRRGVGIELNQAYITLAETRCAQEGLPL